MEKGRAFLAVLLLLLALLVSGGYATTFSFLNKCSFPVWAGTLASYGSPALAQTGFELNGGRNQSLDAPPRWSGLFWGRTGCRDDAGVFKCNTANCGSNAVACKGTGPTPPVTLVEITLADSYDTYDTSLVNGFNLPFSVSPQGGTGNCDVSACAADVNAVCPQDLKVTGGSGETIACNSACDKFNTDEYCCRGPAHNTTETCPPNMYSMQFKKACPSAYSYAFDDETSTFTCKAPTYLLTFCP